MINLEKNTTPFEIIGNLDLRKIADDELDTIIKNLQEESKNRKEAYRLDAWKKLVAHIREYCKEFGSIQIKEDVFINENEDYTTPNEIW